VNQCSIYKLTYTQRVIGKGSYGKVYLVKHRKRGKYFAMKIVRLQGIPKKERESVRTELALLKKLKHPNIVGYEEAFAVKNGTYLAIVMNYCDSGDLAGRLKKQKRPFPEHQVLHWFVQMALGLEFMHSNKVLHRDIKTQNIFLLGNGRLVLGDLGISKSLEGTLDMARTAIGTPYYMSPEMFQNKPYNAKSDVWALGCVLFEMLALRHAFEAKSLNELAKKVVKGRGLPSIPARYSRKAKALVTHMLRRNPRDRPTMAAILTRPYVEFFFFFF
jgi:NIMA (never in mitosis gene a)-related kinase 1/4/5